MPPLDSNSSPFLPRNVLFVTEITNIGSDAMYHIFSVTSEGHFDCNNFHPLRVVVNKSGQCRTSSSHDEREQSTEEHQPVSERISW